MDYEKIGECIRRARKALELSQEELAEKVGISVTHMSHIETGSTKLSIQVLADIACALKVSTDSLLFGRYETPGNIAVEEFARLLEDCPEKKMAAILDIMKGIRKAIDEYMC